MKSFKTVLDEATLKWGFLVVVTSSIGNPFYDSFWTAESKAKKRLDKLKVSFDRYRDINPDAKASIVKVPINGSDS